MSRHELPSHVAEVRLPFRSVDAGTAPGPAIAAEFDAAWPAYRRWYLREGEAARPSYAESHRAVAHYLPELLGDYERLVEAVGGGDLEARFLSHWCPPPLVSACSMAMTPAPSPLLVRNYDYPPLLSDALALRTHWSGRSIIGMADCTWGLMDGVNDAGVAVAIAFGGRRNVGHGFGIGIVVRYLLQAATCTEHAVDLLTRVPVQLSYNVAILDAAGEHRIVAVAPDRPALVTASASAANRQGTTEWPEHAEYCNTVEREGLLARLVSDGTLSAHDVTEAFLRPPLHRSLVESTWGTLYTAVYAPTVGTLDLLWPDEHWRLDLHGGPDEHRPRTVMTLVPDPMVKPAAHAPHQISMVC